MSVEILGLLERRAIVPVVEIERASDAVELARVLADAGLPAMEITLRTSAALEAIRLVRGSVPDVLVGAGTILTPAAAEAAMDAGAAFGVSPGLSEAARYSASCGWPMIPGVVTPSEILAALDAGFDHLKFFPAATYGGAAAVRSLAGPFSGAGVKFMPTGGISRDDTADYLALPSVFAVGGTWIAPRADISAGRWDGIRERAAHCVALAAGAGRGGIA